MITGRRAFISAFGAGCLSVGAATRARAQSKARVQAEFRSEAGSSLEGHEIEFVTWNDGDIDVYRDNIKDGRIDLELPAGSTYDVTLFKESDSGSFEMNGVPLLYGIESDLEINGDESDLGVYEIPEGHLVDIRFEDLDGNPVEGLSVGFRASTGSGTGGLNQVTNSDGLVGHIRNQETGVELSGTVGVDLRDGSPKEVDRLTVTDPAEFVVPVRNPEQYGGVVRSDESTETTEEEANESTETTEEEANESTETTEEGANETESASGSPDTNETNEVEQTDETPKDEEENRTQQASETDERGFFTNNSESSLELLSNPVQLTWVGIAASVLGMVTQLIGRQS